VELFVRSILRPVVIATVAVTCLPLASVAATAAPSPTVGRSRVPTPTHRTVLPVRPASARSAAPIDSTLMHQHGRVDVMLQLADAPAVVPYAAVRASARRLAAARVAAFSAQSARVAGRQHQVASYFSRSATKSQQLYSLHNLYDGIAVRTDASRLAALARIPGVVGVHALVPKKLMNSATVPLIGAPAVWQGAAGNTGAGIRIGIIDTGVDYTHADFGGPGTVAAYQAARATDTQTPSYPDSKHKVAGGFDFAGDAYDGSAGLPGDPDTNATDAVPHPDSNPLDCSGHGTHVAGTAAGYGVAADGTTYSGDYSSLAGLTQQQYSALFKIGPGVAPGASLYALKIFGCGSETGTSSDLIASALDWAAQIQSNGKPRLDVVNMSLGADFATSTDPDAVAANYASLAGVTVVAAAGNAGDLFNAAGAPGDAVRAISVAASNDTQDLLDGVNFSDAGDKSLSSGNPWPAEESVSFDWKNSAVTSANGLTAQLAVIGDGNASDWRTPGDNNNSDGCDPLSSSDAAKVLDKIALLSWTDDDASRRCSSAVRSDNAWHAGAVGVVIVDDKDQFAAGLLGDAQIPAVITTKTAGDPVVADVFKGDSVSATLSYQLHNAVPLVHPATANAVADFSSRGGSVPGSVKPDVTAPGVTVFSANFSTGNDGISDGGTSMATPHVAGVAALVRAAHPTWTSEQVKAGIMNTATQDVYAVASDGASADKTKPLAPERVGVGRVVADAAVADNVLAYATGGSGAVAVSFGPVAATQTETLSKSVTVANLTASAVTYDLSYDAINSNPGASYSVSPTDCSAAGPSASVTVAAQSTAQVVVCLTVNPSQLTSHPDPTLTLKPALAPPYDIFSGKIERDFVSTASGRLILTNTADHSTLRVPVYSEPRPASAMSTPTSMTLNSSGVGTLPLTGTGVSRAATGNDSTIQSFVDAFELQATSGALPACSPSGSAVNCLMTPDDKAADLKYVGFASEAPWYDGQGGPGTAWSIDPAGDGSVPPALGYFGIAMQGDWNSPDYPLVEVLLDLNNDNDPDAVLYNLRIPGTDIFLSELASVVHDPQMGDIPGNVYDDQPINLLDGSVDADVFNSDVMTMPFTLAALAALASDQGINLTGHPRIAYSVDSGSGESGFVDSVGDPTEGQSELSVNLVNPGLSASDVDSADSPCNGVQLPTPQCFPTLNEDQPLDSKGNPIVLTVYKSSEYGGDHPQGILLLHHLNVDGQRAQVVKFPATMKVAFYRSTFAYGYRDPVTITVSSPSGTPTGPVSVYNGSTRVAYGNLSGGVAHLTMSVMSVGYHTLRIVYGGDPAYAVSSLSATVRVVKAATRTTVVTSGTHRVTISAVTKLVSGSGSISGTVSFYDNGHRFARLSTRGTVRVVRTLTRGRHTLTATYSGNANLFSSTVRKTMTAT
jgi:subtilisin family serine protease